MLLSNAHGSRCYNSWALCYTVYTCPLCFRPIKLPTHVLIHYLNKTYSVHCASRLHIPLYGAVHKVLRARGGRGSEKVGQFVTGGGGPRACDVTLLKKFINMKTKIESYV